MARLIKTSFDPARPCTVRRPFTANGRTFAPGDAFEWRRMSISQRAAYLLFEAGKIMHAADYPNEVATLPAPAPTPEPPAPEQPASHEPDDLDALVSLKDLRAIADEIGAPYARSVENQRAAIRAKRALLASETKAEE